nr:unnamed protein product [Haemonchus contortus]
MVFSTVNNRQRQPLFGCFGGLFSKFLRLFCFRRPNESPCNEATETYTRQSFEGEELRRGYGGSLRLPYPPFSLQLLLLSSNLTAFSRNMSPLKFSRQNIRNISRFI